MRGVAEVRAAESAPVEDAPLGDELAQVRVVQGAIDEPAPAPHPTAGRGGVQHEVRQVEVHVLGVVLDRGIGRTIGHGASMPGGSRSR
jgi:hypothetical protein